MPVAWNSKKQSCTTQSSYKAEYIRESIAATNTVWLLKLLFELKIKKIEKEYSIPVYADNDGAIDTAEHKQY